MRSPRSRPVLTLVALLGLLAGCDGTRTHAAHGIVREVSVQDRQVLIAHDEIPGVMPEMTMNIALYDPALLESLRAGDVIDFELTVSRGSFYITAATVVDRVEATGSWARLGDALVPAEPAPPFALIDHNGEPRSLEELRGHTVLLDFIFTRCPGPCPILTATHVSVERSLSAGLLERTRFVSISIDPARDTPQDLAAYAASHGADLGHWSFLTGPVAAVEEVTRAYGVGSTRGEDGELEHVVATFLIDAEGRIVKRYLGLEHAAAEISADIEALASAALAVGA